MNHFLLDGTAVPFTEGDTLMDAAQRAGHSIAHLCWDPALGQSGCLLKATTSAPAVKRAVTASCKPPPMHWA